MGANDFDVGFTGFPTPSYASGNAAGDPSGYGTAAARQGLRNELIVGVVIIAVLFMLIAGVIALRVSGEVVI